MYIGLNFLNKILTSFWMKLYLDLSHWSIRPHETYIYDYEFYVGVLRRVQMFKKKIISQ